MMPPSDTATRMAEGDAYARTVHMAPPVREDPPDDSLPLENRPTIGYVGRYALKYRLGQGGLGTVHAAHDPMLSRSVAVKTLNLQATPEARRALEPLLLREARAAAGLSHPYIVTVHDAGLSDQGVYIAMELLNGRDLRDLMADGWRPDPTQAATIVRRAADAIAYAHGKGVVHCDIKPANIFMVGRNQPKVLDFGIARLTRGDGPNSGHAPIDIDVLRPSHDDADPPPAGGSPHYMAPEQLTGEAVDARCDVYALGVVLYELLTGRRPFAGDTLEQIARAVLTGGAPSAREVNPAVPEALADIAARAMALEPSQRFRSARQMSRALRAAAGEAAHDDSLPAGGPARGLLPAAGDGLAGETAPPELQADLPTEPPASDSAEPFVSAALPSAPPAARREATDRGSRTRAAVPARHRVQRSRVAGAVALVSLAWAAWTLWPAETTPDGTVVSAPAAASPGMPTETPPAPTPLPSATSMAESGSGPASPAPPPGLASATPSGSPAGAAVPVAPPGARNSIAAAPAASPSPPPAARKPADKRPPAAAPPRSARASEAPVAGAAAAAATGVVQLAISPWGQVEVDGEPVGTTPPMNRLTLPVGSHQIVIRNDDLPPFSTTVTVDAEQPVTIRHRF